MRNSDQINGPTEVLSQCIQAIEANKATIESCVAQFPDVPDLEKLLRAMTTAQRLPRPALAPADKSAMRQALLNRYRERQGSKQVPQAAPRRRATSWLRVAAALGIVAIILFMSGAGLVRASSDAVPGDGLYGLKRLVEQVELSSADAQTRPETLYRIALTRVAEVNVLAERRLTLTEGELNDLSQSVRVALVLQTDNVRRTALISTADTALAKAESVGLLTAMRHVEVLQTLSTLPEITTQATPGSDSTVVAVPVRASATPTSTGTAAPTLTPTATGTLTPTGTETPTETLDPTETLTATLEESLTVEANSISVLTPTPTDKAHPTRKPTKSNPGQGTPNGGQGNSGNNSGGNSGGNNGNGKGGGSGGGNSNGKK